MENKILFGALAASLFIAVSMASAADDANGGFRQQEKQKMAQHKQQQLQEKKDFLEKQYQENKDFAGQMHQDKMANIKAKLAQNAKLTDAQKTELINVYEKEYQGNLAYRDKQHEENIAFFNQIAGNPNMTQEQRKQEIRQHFQQQREENKEHKEQVRSEIKQEKEKLHSEMASQNTPNTQNAK